MQMKHNKKFLSLILSMMLIVAMALNTTACGDNNTGNQGTGNDSQLSSQSEINSEIPSQSETETNTTANSQSQTNTITVLGEGNTIFTFTVVDAEKNETVFEIHTDKTTVGDALLELELIAGEVSTYGLYVKTVNGITADYDTDGTYWGFYVNDAYATSGVDTTTITEGDSYSFKISK